MKLMAMGYLTNIRREMKMWLMRFQAIKIRNRRIFTGFI